ncbi:MAG: GNAT family N-acetyltransferase [Burkholderiales bacterium]|nr:GNAT family N-acetyltransferase [Burkholderiales bacterium]MDE2434500.1 GNAT family N-acetyltransferase [Burkholderiales bacterium]
MSTSTIRQAGLADIDGLALMFDEYRQFYGRPTDFKAAKEFLVARFNHGESVLFLATVSGEPAGFVQLYPSFSSVSLARTFILNDLFVTNSFRRQGIAQRLLAAATSYAQAVGAIRLTLSTATNNTEAQSLYKTSGWKRDDQFFVYHLSPLA